MHDNLLIENSAFIKEVEFFIFNRPQYQGAAGQAAGEAGHLQES